MAKLYYIKVKDAEKGPYVKSQIKSLWDRAEITADTFYFCKGMDGWKPLLEMMEEDGINANASDTRPSPSPLPPVLPAVPAALPLAPAHGKDDVLFSDSSFTVTRTRFITPGQTYSMRNITSVKYTKSSPNYLIVFVSIASGLAWIYGAFSGWGMGGGMVIGGIVGAVVFYFVKWLLQPVYEVCLITTAGEASALTSKNGPYTQKIVSALNKAISQH